MIVGYGARLGDRNAVDTRRDICTTIRRMKSKAAICGSVSIEPNGDECVIRSVKFPDLFITIPLKVVEAWALRKLREETLQPAAKAD